jgi:hypothetical protein
MLFNVLGKGGTPTDNKLNVEASFAIDLTKVHDDFGTVNVTIGDNHKHYKVFITYNVLILICVIQFCCLVHLFLSFLLCMLTISYHLEIDVDPKEGKAIWPLYRRK